MGFVSACPAGKHPWPCHCHWAGGTWNPFLVMSPDHLLTRALSALGVVVSPPCISVLPAKGDAQHGEVVGLIGSKGLPLPCYSLQCFTRGCSAAGSELLLPSAHCSEKVTGCCLTSSLQVKSWKEAERRQDAAGLRGSLQAVMCQLDLCETGRVQEGITALPFPTSSQQGSGHQVSMTSSLPPHPKIQGRAPRTQGSPSGVLQAMTGDLPPQKESASSSSARTLLQGQPGSARE